MHVGLMSQLGTLFKAVLGNPPALPAAGARNSAAIDRATPGGNFFNSATLVQKTGAIAGSPSAQTVDAKIQDSPDGSTGWADYKPDGVTTAAIAQLTAANAVGEVDVDLSGAKRYIRVVETVAFTAGTSPTIGADSTVILAGADRTPV